MITLFFSLQGLCQSYQQQKLMDLQYRRFMAMSANDTSLLSKYLADDLVYIHSNGSIDSKTSLLKGIASGNIHFISIVAEKRTASIDGNFAWIYGTANLTFKINNSEMTIHNYISFIDFFA